MTVPMTMLALLQREPNHGFALKQRYDRLFGQDRELRPAQIYSTLARLERDGHLDDLGFAKGNAADKRLYAITDSGVSTVQQWIRTPGLPAGRPSELFTKVILALVSGLDPRDVLDAHRDLFLHRMREVTAARRTGDAVDRLAGDYELAHLTADLDWIETAGRRIGDLTKEIS
ncbi:PadR family transcriptional regulator [Calidifontibacter terrae]